MTLISNLIKITSRAILKRIEYAITESHIMTKSKFAYFKNISSDDIVLHVMDLIADSKLLNNDDFSFLLLSCDYSTAIDTVSKEYIYKFLSLMNFPYRTTQMIYNLYANALCKPLIID